MKIHTAVIAIERTVIDAQAAIEKHFTGNLANSQIRVELEGIWQVVKLLASAIDDDGVTIRNEFDAPTRADIDAIVKSAADRAAEQSADQRRRRRH